MRRDFAKPGIGFALERFIGWSFPFKGKTFNDKLNGMRVLATVGHFSRKQIISRKGTTGQYLGLWFMAYSDRTYVGTGPGPGPEWVTVYYVKSSHCDLCGNLNGSYTLAMYWSWSWSRSHSHISSVWKSHHSGSRQSHPIHQVWTCPYPSLSLRCGPPRSQADRQTAAQCEHTPTFKPGVVVHPVPKETTKQQDGSARAEVKRSSQ